MSKNTGLFTPHHRPPASGTSPTVLLRHAGFVRPCARNLRGQEQKGGAGERDVEIVVGPHGPVIQIRKEKTSRKGTQDGRSNSTD